MNILVINGPNLNMLGIREPNHYGKETYHDLLNKIQNYANEKGVTVDFRQSNHEGDLVAFSKIACSKTFINLPKKNKKTVLLYRSEKVSRNKKVASFYSFSFPIVASLGVR